jgi:hypothetical protein
MKLIDEAEVALRNRRAQPRLDKAKGHAPSAAPARRRRIQPAEQMQQRALAGAGSADDGDRSPTLTSRSTPSSTGTSSPPWLKVLLSP